VSSVPIVESLVAPIDEVARAGRDLTYEPHFQEIGAEVEKTSSLAGHTVDWQRVREQASRMLREESKDLRLASWWFVAATYLDGFAGLQPALSLYRSLLDLYWDGMFPSVKRARARAGLVEWAWEGSRKALSSRDLGQGELEEARASLVLLTELDRALSEKLGDLNPGAGSLRSLLREKVEGCAALTTPAAPAPAPAPPPPSATEAQEEPAGTTSTAAARVESPARVAPIPTVAEAIASNEDVHRIANQLREKLFALADSARKIDPAHPLPYRLNRNAAWMSVDGPPDVEGGKTFVRPPDPDDARNLRAMLEGKEWERLREAAESALSGSIFWFDLHYFSYSALERLGATFASARSAVLQETASFLQRVPDLETLCFRDGTPFAHPETAAWLRAHRPQGPVDPAAAPAVASDDPVEILVASARGGRAEGNPTDALAGALVQAQSLRSARERFRARLGLARVALTDGRREIGLSLLERLVTELDPSLESWEPQLCGEAISALLSAVSFRAGTTGDASDRHFLLFRRLLQLDPMSALRLGGS
jgi:type VI secretion system protein VasJ